MKSAFIFFTINFLIHNLGICQDYIRPYIGVNTTNVKYYFEDKAQNIDSSSLKLNNAFLPELGCEVYFSVNDKFRIYSGLAVSWMGSRNFNEGIPDEINIDKDLKLGYLKVPLAAEYRLFDQVSLFAGGVVNYNFRKNQGFFTVNSEGEYKSFYQPFHIGAIIGLGSTLGKYNLKVNYYQGISRIFDTKDIDNNARAYLTLSGFQFSVGCLIE